MLFLRGAQLVMRSNILTVLDLDGMDVTIKNAEIFGSVLFGEGATTTTFNGWRCY
jgi:hypothetical protein